MCPALFYVPSLNSQFSIFRLRLLLFLGRRFLPRLFSSALLLGVSLRSVPLRRLCLVLVSMLVVCCRNLLRLRLFLLNRRSLEALPVEIDFCDAHRRERLPVPTQLLVLLLPFVVEDQNLRPASFLHNFADHARLCLRLVDRAFATRNRQNIGKAHLAIGSRSQFLHSNHIARRHPVLLPTGADNR